MSHRVRFSPSPTGLLHIGSARTALFNWLYAKHIHGTFILRIEDTDAARNTQQAVDVIFQGLKWLGLEWDEGPLKGGNYEPYFQSQRRTIYQCYIQRLLDAKLAYEDNGAIRFRLPKKMIRAKDLICGSIDFDLTPEPDMTVVRPDGSFLFHLVNVVDDIEMKITHVIRGEDHLSNLPKHLALFEAFGVTPPVYAHIPLILNRDGSKMSKRDEGAAVSDYMEKGYTPEAVRNYLCLLGWSPKDNREILPIEELITLFDLTKVNRHNARFDIDKLHWMNGQYLAHMSLERFTELGRPFLEKEELIQPFNSATAEEDRYVRDVLTTVQEKIKLLADLPTWTTYFFRNKFPFDPQAVSAVLKSSGACDRIRELHQRYEKRSKWVATQLESDLKALAAEHGFKTGDYIHPCRVACSGRSVGPSLYRMLEVLGRERVLARLVAAQNIASAT